MAGKSEARHPSLDDIDINKTFASKRELELLNFKLPDEGDGTYGNNPALLSLLDNNF